MANLKTSTGKHAYWILYVLIINVFPSIDYFSNITDSCTICPKNQLSHIVVNLPILRRMSQLSWSSLTARMRQMKAPARWMLLQPQSPSAMFSRRADTTLGTTKGHVSTRQASFWTIVATYEQDIIFGFCTIPDVFQWRSFYFAFCFIWKTTEVAAAISFATSGSATKHTKNISSS